MTETVKINGRSFTAVSSTPARTAEAMKKKPRRTIPLCGPPSDGGSLSLSMTPPSVNALYYNRKNGKGRGKTLAYRNWCTFAKIELGDQPEWHVPGRVGITIRVGGSRADADNLLKATIDALVNAGRIMDDRLVMEARAFHDASVAGTRIEIVKAKPPAPAAHSNPSGD